MKGTDHDPIAESRECRCGFFVSGIVLLLPTLISALPGLKKMDKAGKSEQSN